MINDQDASIRSVELRSWGKVAAIRVVGQLMPALGPARKACVSPQPPAIHSFD